MLPLVRRLPEAQETGHGFDLGPFGNGWPTATVMLEPAGLHSCDYGGGTAQLGLLVAWPIGEFGSVTVSEV